MLEFFKKDKEIDPAQVTVKMEDVCMFTRQFVCMMDAGIPLLRALDYYVSTDPSLMGQIIQGVADSVRSGTTLSKGLSLYPKVFSPLYVGLVRAGEGTGALDGMLVKIVEVLERQSNLMAKLKAALTYPAVVMVVAFFIFLAFIFVILPALQPMLTSVHVVPPWPTQMLMLLGVLIRNPVVDALVVALVIGSILAGPKFIERLRRDEAMAIKIDRMPLMLPAFGDLMRRILVSRILFALATTVDSGLSITHSLHLARGTTGNAYVGSQIQKVHDYISDGHTLAEGMDETTLFFKGATQMVAMGEESSSLSSSLMYLARLYDSMAEESINGMAALIEPFLMGSMGVMAGFLILATILPIVNMLKSL